MVLPPVVLKSLNLVTYIIAATTIVLSREHIQDALNGHPNFLSNSHLGYAIPALSAFLLGGFTLVQWFDFAYEIVVDGVQWHLFASNLVVAAWALSWRFDLLVVGQALLLVNALLIYALHSNVRRFTATNIVDFAFVHVSFSLYTGLVSLDVLQNFFAAFTDKEDGPMSWAALGAAGAIVVLLAIGNYHAEFSKDPDSWSGGAIALMILSIAIEQGETVPVVQNTGFISFGWLAGALVRRGINSVELQRSLDDDYTGERRHLLG
ncbi:hypothetical protein BGZ99_006623 [Dissophora globulifera]|uniref:Uncharacterized protein n=1 Tax=Dissophora globulifera TaxID=979702 RepID=A0A9P6REB9_9FUNG|nr:hypothetical protein BGZ99_006623 [Dissophora globulifera]